MPDALESDVAVSGDAGVTIHVSNDDEGIGLDPFDHSSDFGVPTASIEAVVGLNFAANGPLLHETAQR